MEENRKIEIIKKELNELQYIVDCILKKDTSVEATNNSLYCPVQAFCNNHYFISLSRDIEKRIDSYSIALEFHPQTIILGEILSGIWADSCIEEYDPKRLFLLLFGNNCECLYNDIYGSYRIMHNKSRQHIGVTDHLKVPNGTNRQDDVITELIRCCKVEKLLFNELDNSCSQDENVEILNSIFCNTIKEIFCSTMLPDLVPDTRNYDELMSEVRWGIREGMYREKELFVIGHLNKCMDVIENMNSPREFAYWYVGDSIQLKYVVPILYAKAIINKNTEFVKILKPLLTEEIKNSYSELFKVIDNYEFLDLVPRDEDTWALDIDCVICRGKQIYNNLHPDDMQVIPVDKEKMLLALSNEATWQPELPEENPETTDANNIEENQEYKKDDEGLGENGGLPLDKGKEYGESSREYLGGAKEIIEGYKKAFCKLIAAQCTPNDCADLIEYFFWGPKSNLIPTHSKVRWKGEMKELLAYISYAYENRNLPRGWKVKTKNVFDIDFENWKRNQADDRLDSIKREIENYSKSVFG